MDLEQVFFPAPFITTAKLVVARRAQGAPAVVVLNEQRPGGTRRVELGDEMFYCSVERAFVASVAQAEAPSLMELGTALREILALGSELWAQKSSD